MREVRADFSIRILNRYDGKETAKAEEGVHMKIRKLLLFASFIVQYGCLNQLKTIVGFWAFVDKRIELKPKFWQQTKYFSLKLLALW